MRGHSGTSALQPHHTIDGVRFAAAAAEHLPAVIVFFEALDANGDGDFFHPHPLTAEGAAGIVALSVRGRDEYWLALSGDTVVAYGMLRGWDEGYDVPSLGLAVAPSCRRQGFARQMMNHLHDRAKRRGARRIRLKVDRRNESARVLYESLGYRFAPHSPTEFVGYCDIMSPPSSPPPRTARPPSLPVAMPDLTGNEERYAVDAIRSSWISSSGAYLERLEREFAAACQCDAALGVSNGTVALHLALLALDVRPGDEVLVPSLTYIATANAVRYVGAEPVFVDVDPATWCIDPATIEAAVTRRTRGIIAVHLYGHPADMDAINHLAAVHGLWVVEDAAEAHFATYKGRVVGSLARCATFSFYGNKILTCGEGGAVTVSDPQLALRMRTLRGQGVDPHRRYYFPVTGYNFRMTNLAAAILCAQLERKDTIVAKRRQIYQWYRERLDGVPGIGFQPIAPWATITPWLMCLLIEPEFGRTRDEVMAGLAEAGVDTRPFFIPLHTLPPFRQESLARQERLPVTSHLATRGINLPTYTALTPEHVGYVCDALTALARR
ncbi:MAG: GNAT family N-acetyltransferase [Planctomycetia bacterium]|nr:GNAT family N-acetyltransferase [Planctomycetia bacterium]